MRELMKDVMKPKDTCSICDAEYNPDEGGVQGYFGIMPVTFCVWCHSSMTDMVFREHNIDPDDLRCGMSRK